MHFMSFHNFDKGELFDLSSTLDNIAQEMGSTLKDRTFLSWGGGSGSQHTAILPVQVKV